MKSEIKSRPLLGIDGKLGILKIELDSAEIYPRDPGMGTPAMVTLFDGSGRRELDSGTYWCAVEQGELSHNGTTLSVEQGEWLESQRDTVDTFIRENNPPSEAP